MSPLYEKIKKQIPELTEAEQFGLYAQLRRLFEFARDTVDISPEWSREIEARAEALKKGKIKLIPKAEVDREIDAILARRNLKRLATA